MLFRAMDFEAIVYTNSTISAWDKASFRCIDTDPPD